VSLSTAPAAEEALPERASVLGVRGALEAALSWTRLETAARTRLYWAALALVAATLFIPRLLPCVDYPQHLALSDVARRLGDPHAPEHASFTVNWLTYNGLFHLLVARLGVVMPIELAGRIVVALSLVSLGAGVLALVRLLGRPPSHAALFVPAIFSFSVGWGFVNYALATSVAVWSLVLVARMLTKPSLATAYALTAMGLLCAFAHVLAMLLLCLLSAAIAPEVAWRAAAKPGRRPLARVGFAFLRMAGAALPLLAGCAFCVGIYAIQYDWDPNMYKDPTVEGTAPSMWLKLVLFPAYTTGLHRDRSDQAIIVAGIVLMVVVAVLAFRARRRGEEREGPPALVLPLVCTVAAYLATPMVWIGTHLIFPRLAQLVVLGAVLALPSLRGRAGVRVARLAVGMAALTGVNLAGHSVAFAFETNDASRVIDDLPEGRRVTSVTFRPGTFAFRHGALVHLAAYYAARKHGEWAYGFGRYLSVPVRFKPGTQPPWPAHGWEFDGDQYDVRCGYARYYDLVIVREPKETPTDPAAAEALVRQVAFKQDAAAVRLLSHHGPFWAFDTKGVPADGTL
jgi:hypothetical protein